MKSREWKWKFFAVRFHMEFWLLAVGVEFQQKGDRGVGIGIGPFSLHIGEV